MALHHDLDPHSKPPNHIRNRYKSYLKKRDLGGDVDILDFERSGKLSEVLKQVGIINQSSIVDACLALEANKHENTREIVLNESTDRPVYESPNLPGRL
jgi:hypothetical protein